MRHFNTFLQVTAKHKQELKRAEQNLSSKSDLQNTEMKPPFFFKYDLKINHALGTQVNLSKFPHSFQAHMQRS